MASSVFDENKPIAFAIVGSKTSNAPIPVAINAPLKNTIAPPVAVVAAASSPSAITAASVVAVFAICAVVEPVRI